jgi:hypothetical protein
VKTLIPAVVVLAMATGAARVASDDVALVPPPKDPHKVNFTGSWQYRTTNHHVTGTCPVGTPTHGTLEIGNRGGAVTLTFKSGIVCKPESLCHYTGAINGDDVVLSSHAVVDNEGGSATNAIRLSIYSATRASGEVSSRYVHPQGFECHWTYRIELSRDQTGH